MREVIFGIGGYCEHCDPATHDHPLHNIVRQNDLLDPEPTPEELVRQSAIAKLQAIGLTAEEAQALLGISSV